MMLIAVLAVGTVQPSPELFIRDQPVLGRLLRWNGGWVAKADRLYAIDIRRMTLKPLEHSAMNSVMEIAEVSGGSLLFGVKGRMARLVGAMRGSRDPEIPLPAEVLADPSAWRLAAGGDRVVLLSSKLAFSCSPPHWKWSLTKLSRELWRGGAAPDEPKAIAISGTQVFVAVDQGEWGGGLWSIALANGKVSLVEGDSDPATGLALDDKGRVWATWGLAHLVGLRGTLRVLEGGKWKLVSRTDNLDQKRQRNWSLPPTSYESVAFERGRVFVLTSTLGVVELVDGSWRRRTAGWPDHQYVNALGMSMDTAIVGTYDAGVIVWNLRSGEKRTLRMRSGRSR